ncbi:hypothetical protein DYB26_014601 [Aphanomyces astaci]|uniref:Uncharacterized protein n=1 Tax=Aphanomyces astaci TaxID=112090 RepID=A0A397FMC9_APHAT|nr:hypothetical protein DYB34_004711 [Aphanomyces astaci]RHZ18383.1 hypothetical protein DYB26_014601 [Aphanomyces astaci]RHZ32836.1 hypothetical protein DYB31_003945 [Aphanomyces astaci]
MRALQRSFTSGNDMPKQQPGSFRTSSSSSTHSQEMNPYQLLLEAVERSDATTVERLLHKGFQPATQDINMSILSAACLSGSYDVFEQLVTQGWLVFAAILSETATTPILFELVNLATQGGNIQIITGLCRVGGITVDEVVEHMRGPSGVKVITPLLIAAINGDDAMVHFLVDGGVDINMGMTKEGNSPLGMATIHGHISVVEVLLESGANPHHTNLKGESVYALAAAYGHANIMCLLLHEESDRGDAMKLGDVDESSMKRTIHNIRKGKSHTHYSLQERGGHVDVTKLKRRITNLKNRVNGRVEADLYALRSSSSLGEESF